MDVSCSDPVIYFEYICAKTSCVWTCLAFRLTIECLRNQITMQICKICRHEREPPKPLSSKSATGLLLSLCKVLKYTC